jgi:hypothetical protein
VGVGVAAAVVGAAGAVDEAAGSDRMLERVTSCEGGRTDLITTSGGGGGAAGAGEAVVVAVESAAVPAVALADFSAVLVAGVVGVVTLPGV